MADRLSSIASRKARQSLTFNTEGLSLVKIASPKLQSAHLALTRKPCLVSDRTELKDRVDNAGAQEVTRRWWRGLGEGPEVKGRHASVAAEAHSCVGILTGWMRSKNQIAEAQESAKIRLQRESY